MSWMFGIVISVTSVFLSIGFFVSLGSYGADLISGNLVGLQYVPLAPILLFFMAAKSWDLWHESTYW